MMGEKPFNPLDKLNLGKSVANAIFNSPVFNLSEITNFKGAGIYALYYTGNFPEYQFIKNMNKDGFNQPIYAGKAVPEGARKGGLLDDYTTGQYLYKRLTEHKKSIDQVSNIKTNDFFFRCLVVDDIWIPLGEALLIETSKPLWNLVIDGFGNHDPGSGRYKQQISPWDIIHPGRSWAGKLQPGKSINDIKNAISEFVISYEKGKKNNQ